MAKKIVFLDRDGTIIIDKHYLNDPKDIEYYPDSFAALQLLRQHGYELVIATNQSGLSRGLVKEQMLEQIHTQIVKDCAIQGIEFLGIYYCAALPDEKDPCRKPEPGMLLQAAKDHGPIDFSQSWMIGDRMSDVECGHRAGCRSILLQYGSEPEKSSFAAAELTTNSLLEAARWVVK